MSRRPTRDARLRPRPAVAAVWLVLAATLVAGLVAPGTSAASRVRRTWTAEMGGGRNGTITLRAFMDGTGSLGLDLTGLAPATAYPLIIYTGTCSQPKTITRFTSSVSDTSGAIKRTKPASVAQMNAIWGVARTGSIAVRIGAGSLARCGLLRFEVATRVAIPSLRIDLPVVRPPNGYPLCNVAMYIKELSQPREPGVTYIYAHAREGMFLPLLERSKVNDGASLIGLKIRVWTSDSVLSTYEITRVRRHVTTLDGVFGITSEQLWLQTSEGPRGTVAKLIVVARRLSSVPTDYASAHPTPRPIVCS